MRTVFAIASAVVVALAVPAEARQYDGASGHHHRHLIRDSDGARYARPKVIARGSNASVFCDRKTATGSMNCNAMVFAHRTLPLGSTHSLSCNGRVIVARVIDRGPAFWTHRSFDLSPGLARACGINGLGNVHLI